MYLKTFEEMKKTSVFFMLKPANAIYGFIVTVCISIVSVISWASFSPMDDVVKATVQLRPNAAVSSIKCVTSGQLQVKNYKNDDSVCEGQLLFSLDTAAFQTELESFQMEKKKNENDILINEILLNTINNGDISQDTGNVNALLKSSNYLSEYKKFETGIQDLQIKLKREEEKPASLRIPQNIVDLKNQLSQNELAFESWKTSQKFQALELNKQLQSTKSNIESRITELERAIKNATIYSPISGRITEVTKMNIGDYILAGEEVIKIIPQNEETLKADIYVDPSYVARVKVGNPVKIKFPGLPPSRYGQVETEITIVPPDVTLMPNGQPVFIVEAEIEKPYLRTKNGQTAKLLPGITAEGRIVTDRSTVMQMVLRKLDFIN